MRSGHSMKSSRFSCMCARTSGLAGLAIAILAGGLGVAPVTVLTASLQSAPERLTVRSDGHPMAVWARRPATPRGAVLLVHGRTWSGRPDFDLQVPGLERS